MDRPRHQYRSFFGFRSKITYGVWDYHPTARPTAVPPITVDKRAVFQYDPGTAEWLASDLNLGFLQNVDLSAAESDPSNQYVLEFNPTTQLWEAHEPATGGNDVIARSADGMTRWRLRVNSPMNDHLNFEYSTDSGATYRNRFAMSETEGFRVVPA